MKKTLDHELGRLIDARDPIEDWLYLADMSLLSMSLRSLMINVVNDGKDSRCGVDTPRIYGQMSQDWMHLCSLHPAIRHLL